MWKNILIKTLNRVVRSMVGAGVFDEIKELVTAYTNSDLSGEEKRKEVHKELNDLKGAVGRAVSDAGSVLINLVIETVLIGQSK